MIEQLLILILTFAMTAIFLSCYCFILLITVTKRYKSEKVSMNFIPSWSVLFLIPATWLIFNFASHHIFKVFPLIEEPQGSELIQSKVKKDAAKSVQNEIKSKNIPLTIESFKDSLDEVQLGRQLFNGKITFINEGPGCITCHQVVDDSLSSGGLIAPELTNVFSRLDEPSLTRIILFPYHLTMQQVYQDRQVTEEEAQVLMTFFEYAANRSSIQKKRNERAAGFLNRIKKGN